MNRIIGLIFALLVSLCAAQAASPTVTSSVNSSQNWFTSASGTTASLTVSANDVVVVHISIENNSGTSATTVSTVAQSAGTAVLGGTGFARRFQSASDTWVGTTVFGRTEVWWAYITTGGTLTTKVTTALSVDNGEIIAFNVAGTGTPSSPWDPNSSLPKTASTAVGSTTVPTASSVSTTDTNDLIIGGYSVFQNAAFTSTDIPSGTSLINSQNNGAGSQDVTGATFDEAFATAQSNISFAPGSTAGGKGPGIVWIDALTANVQAASCSLTLALLGAGC